MPQTLAEIRELLETVNLDAPGFLQAKERLIEEAAALRYFLARQDDPTLPPINLIFGPSGSGKSTLFNLLAGREHAHTSSVERPASRGALIGAKESVIEKIKKAELFPTFDLTEPSSAGPQRGQEGRIGLVPIKSQSSANFETTEDDLLVDSPDFDTRITENRHIAERLIRWADRIVFVTSVERYADRSAAAYLQSMDELSVPTLYVLNKVEDEDPAELMRSFRERLMGLGGPSSESCFLPRAAQSQIEQSDGMKNIREFLHRKLTDERRERRLRRFLKECRSEACAPLETWRQHREAVLYALNQVLGASRHFDHGPDLANLERFEDETRFWLRLSPRSLWRGTQEIMRRPKSLFESPKLPGDTERQEIASLVVEQAWHVVDQLQTRIRETLKSDTLGQRALADPSFNAADLDREALQHHFAPLIDRLTDFSRKTLDRFRSEHEARRGNWLAKFRYWAVDKVLKLMFLSLHVTVVPIFVYNLLEKIGVESFSNEVKEEFRTNRELFNTLLQKSLSAQVEGYAALVDKLGPDPTVGQKLEERIRRIESRRS